MAGSSGPSVDGRTARRDRNKEAVLDALIELFAEDVEPSPDLVAERSGISPRSVYRYFDDRRALLRAAMDRHRARVLPLFLIEDMGVGPFPERVTRFVQARLQLYGAVATVSRAARHRAARDPMIAAQYHETRVAMREQLEQHFAPEFDEMSPAVRAARLDALDALLQLESLEYLVHIRELPENEAAAEMSEVLRVLLSPSGS